MINIVNSEELIEKVETEKKYSSSKLLLEYISKEYDKEDERSKNIDTRISIFITISTLFLGYIFSDNRNSSLSTLATNYKLYAVYVILYFLCTIIVLSSIFAFVSVVYKKNYRRINIRVFDDRDLNNEYEGKSAYELIRGYKEAIEVNNKINDLKVKRYTIGIILVTASVVLFVILKVFMFLML